ncbi:MAG TPA: succinate dehydrogenase/fumarate reductase iron-sulfur subunit [Chloroflexota bacterium]|nr:succinate dehydrogenase/fumarate reductase iron-sulfur subunit [Chloroflexota bacterium]
MRLLDRKRREAAGRTVTFRIKRFGGEIGARSLWQRYDLTVRPRMSVLDALFEIMEDQDGTLGFRYSCRAEMCGSCGMVIDGRERLACGTRLDALGRSVSIEPLRNLPVIKDLVVDLAPFYEKYAAVTPYFVGSGAGEPAVIPPSSVIRTMIDQQLGCITCGACFSACPIVAASTSYLGPAALNRAFSLIADSRDTAGAERLARLVGDDGIFSCRDVSNCVEVCPVQIEPLAAIQRLRKRVVGGLLA